jgi:hypothetical protein
MLQVGERVRFVSDEDDALSFPEWHGRTGTVTRAEPDPSDPYPYYIRFDFNSKEWPVKATELEKIEGNI